MAKIKWSAIGITNASGKSGGTVFSHNRGGSYVRRWAKPTNAQSAAQTAMRSIFGNVAKFWGSLSQNETDVWQEEAANVTKTDAFGDQRTLNGFEYFMQVNYNRIHGMGLPMLRLPIEKFVLPSVKFLGNEMKKDDNIKIRFSNGTQGAEFVASLGFAVVPQGQNRNYGSVKNKFSNRTRISFTNLGEEEDINIPWATIEEAIGDVPEGTTVFVQVHVHDESGQKSNESTNRYIVTE